MRKSRRRPRHQPMNWRDSIRASDNRHAQGCSQSVLAYAASSEPMKENFFTPLYIWYVLCDVAFVGVTSINSDLKCPLSGTICLMLHDIFK